MKISKKKMTILAFTVGTSLFFTTAFADTLLGSGYDTFKQSIKTTSAQMEKGLDNYTLETMFTLKDNGKTIMEESMIQKSDVKKQTTETNNVSHYLSGDQSNYYSYMDKQRHIWKRGDEDKYYTSEFSPDSNQGEAYIFSDPFKEQGAREMEKIADALIGNLKEYVVAEDTPEGGNSFSGHLSATQVPALVNAVSSFGVKQMIRDQNRHEKKGRKIEDDVFVKKVTGTALENANGIMEHVTGDIVFSGKDKKGVEHDLILNVVFKLSDIGNTQITPPDLTDTEVEYVNEVGGFSTKHVGTYKNNIVIEKESEIIKVGERTVEIQSIDNGIVSGTFVETIKPGFEADYPDPDQFTFEYKENGDMSLFTYQDAKGEQQKGDLHMSNTGKIYVQLGIVNSDEQSYSVEERPDYDGEFQRVFEEE